jgi:MSHA biogenesis protein MshM
MDYLMHFGLREPPFAVSPGSRFFYQGHSHREAVNFLERAVGSQDMMAALTGESGSGKSACLDHVLSHAFPHALVARLPGIASEPEQFIRDLLSAFGFEDVDGTRDDARGLIAVFLGHQRQKGVTTIIRAEGTPAISANTVDELGWLALLEPTRMGRLKFLMIGEDVLERQLAAPRMQALRQMTRWQHRLESLSESESLDYLEFRLEAAGCPKPGEIFTEEAAQRIHRVATGLPAQINRLATAALVSAAAAGVRRVDANNVVVGSADLRAAVRRRSSRQRVASLDIVLGDRPLGRIGLTSPRILIGRHPWNDVQLDDDSVSRHHALLVREGGYWTVIDLNSTNGIEVNDRQVRQQRLRHGDRIIVGRFQLRLDEGRSPASDLPPAGDFGETLVLDR